MATVTGSDLLRRRPPAFWQHDGVFARMLSPIAALYAFIGRLRWAAARPWRARVPVICVGAVAVGGAGKTPVAIAIARYLLRQNVRVHFLSRGYGGRQPGPLRVDPDRHSAAEVGDEALLLARHAPTWIGGNRRRSAEAAIDSGAQVLIMDDGFQNPSLYKDIGLLVFDLGGLGNRRVVPAGPLREPIGDALGRAQALVLVDDREGPVADLSGGGLPILRGRMVPDEEASMWRGRRVLAFAGIGRPEKFFATIEQIGAELVLSRAFPDHYPYTAEDIMRLAEEASMVEAVPVTTEKDYTRLDPTQRLMVHAIAASFQFADETVLERVLRPIRARCLEG